MRSSTTPPAARDKATTPLHGATSPALRLVAKAVLGVAGFAGFALLGAGGAWLYKQHVAGTAAAPVGSTARLPAEPLPPAASAALPVAADPEVVASPPAPAASMAMAQPEASLPERDLTLEAPTAAGLPAARAPMPHVPARPAHATAAQAAATSSHADRAACLARVNAITVDVSLRHEPPTPEQLAILKRGCK
jgi:hypothetical protein